MDYADMLRVHLENNATCTISVQQVSMEEATRLGIMNVGPDGTVCEFEEKPAHPKSDLASMGIYIFNWKKLREYLIADEADPNSAKDFGKNIIPNMLNAGEKLWPYRFDGYWRDVETIVSLWDANMDMLSSSQIDLYDPNWPISSRAPIAPPHYAGEKLWPYRFDGYWRDVGTIVSLWDANMDMLSSSLIDLYDPDWPISSRAPIAPPHYAGENARIVHSIVTEGCVIDGNIENSVLSTSVTVEKGANVIYSVIMPGAVIEEGATVQYSIVGENTVIGKGAVVGMPPDGSDKWSVATCGPDITIREGARVPAGAMIYTGEEV